MATTTTLTKTIQTLPVSWANGDLASTGQYISSVITMTTGMAAKFFVQLGRRTGTAFTAGWPNIRIEASGKSSGNDAWIPVASVLTPAVGASIVNTTLSSQATAGASTFAVASATNIAIGDYILLGHTTTPANYELVRVKSLSGTTITPEEVITNTHDSGAQVTDQAESWGVTVACDCDTRLRVVVDNANSGQAVAVQVMCTTLDSILNT